MASTDVPEPPLVEYTHLLKRDEELPQGKWFPRIRRSLSTRNKKKSMQLAAFDELYSDHETGDDSVDLIEPHDAPVEADMTEPHSQDPALPDLVDILMMRGVDIEEQWEGSGPSASGSVSGKREVRPPKSIRVVDLNKKNEKEAYISEVSRIRKQNRAMELAIEMSRRVRNTALSLRRHRHANANGDKVAQAIIDLQYLEITPEHYELLLSLDAKLAVKGLAPEVLQSFTTRSANNEDVGIECGVCLDEFTQASRVMELPCGHRFHKTCITKWLASSCRCPSDNLELA